MRSLPTNEERRRFEAARAAVADAARKAEDAQLSLFEARQSLKRAGRHSLPRAGHEDRVQNSAAKALDSMTALNDGREAFKTFTDPRVGASMLDDATPFLLFPLRIETRFGSVTNRGSTRPQLCVRVYPDDCLIDSFEPLPSETEIASAQRYWTNMWRARSIEPQERGAWRSFVASHGSGRAAWLEANYKPLNIATKPHNPAVNALVLVIPTETPIVDPEAALISAFWRAIWLADGKRADTDVATNELRNKIGNDVRAQELIDGYKPTNLGDEPPVGLARNQINVVVAFVEFPKTADLPAMLHSWSQPARSRLLPDRLVLLAYANGGAKVIEVLGNPIPWPLNIGPDPQASDAEQIRQEDGEIKVGEDLRWLTDFDRAVQVGMGFRVDLTSAMATKGFERMLVLGLRLSADPAEGTRLLEELLRHHRDGTSGFAVLKQGTPTNNTEDESSGFTRTDEADRSFDERLHPGAALRTGAPWDRKLDGEWLADAFGIDPALLNTVGGSRNTDQLEAQAMNVTLWPATLGYSLETMLHPIFDGDDVDRVRWFYQRFVTGRGLLPAIRLGHQPYGILPTTAMSRLEWPAEQDLGVIPGAEHPPGLPDTLSRLYKVLKVMGDDWAEMAKTVSRVGVPGDPHQVLLDIIGLHPASVEYYQRYAESLDDLYNRTRFYGWGAKFAARLTASLYEVTGMAHLARLGYAGGAVPDLLNRLFIESANLLKGPLVDDVPLSETAELRQVTADPWNYIEWLHNAAGTSIDKLREESGFTGGEAPKSLLYLLLRHALLQQYFDSSLRLGQLRGVMDDEAVKAARKEPSFIHVQQETRSGESRWRTLYSQNQQLTGDPAMLVADYIAGVIGTSPATAGLNAMLAALDVLKHLPTARLERLFAEHLDTCSYRLDAWQQGLVHYSLAYMRYKTKGRAPIAKPGIFLGAFGWLEHVRPRTRQLSPVPRAPELDASFHAAGLAPLVHDSTNGGYIHAPSLNQAVAAAVLRNGYLANATPTNPDAFAVNLSSQRVRLALSFLEGVRQGQSLGALLGYQLERALHDGYALGEVDEHIYALRKKFPLVADRNPDTASAATDSIELIEAKNVVDGLQLVEYVKNRSSKSYPFGFTDLPSGAGGKGAAIDKEVERLIDTTDAIADLKVADSVYHAVQGNYDGVAATLESSGSGQLPPEPAVIKTPRSGRTVTHRVALHLKSGLDEDITPLVGIDVTPRARAEPALNAWLSKILPAPDTVACTLSWFDPAANRLQSRTVTQKDIGLQPIDLLYAASLETDQAMGELDDRILLFAHQTFVSRADAAVTILYRTPIVGSVTFFELAPLIRSLRPLLMHSRPLRPTDAVPQGKASSSMDSLVKFKPDRVTKVQTALDTALKDIITFRDALEPLHTDPPKETQILAGLDGRLTSFAALLARASLFGLGDTGWGFILEFKRSWFSSVLTVVRQKVDRFNDRLAECDARLAAYDPAQGGMTETERFSALAAAERYVRKTLTIPPPHDAVAYRLSVGASRADFAARLAQLRAILTMVTQSVGVLRMAVRGAIDGPPALADLDPETMDLAEFDKGIVNMSAELLSRSKRLITAIQDSRLTPAATLIKQHNDSADPATRARLLCEAAKLLLGQEAILIPEFKLDDDQGLAVQDAYGAGVAGTPLTYQRTVRQTPEPVDTWLYGVARVREKMQHWEQSVMLTGAFGAPESDLVPIQVPWKSGEHWLGLEYPATFKPDGDRLCYTAHFVQPFDRTEWQCGVLIDEWTEVIPAAEETTGLTFHYDRPNAEAPQAFLLVTPPVFTGSWQWQDIVDAVSETLDRAKNRAVEPAHVDQTAYAPFLPMTVMAATLYQVSIMTNLARNNDFYTYIKGITDG